MSTIDLITPLAPGSTGNPGIPRRRLAGDVPSSDGQPASIQAFLGWAAHRKSPRGDSLSTSTIKNYLLIWRSWLEFVAGAGLSWDNATGQDVSRFLTAAEPSSDRHKAASDVTQRRYWTLLDSIYSHALHNSMCSANPARALRGSGEVPNSEHVDSVTLQPAHLAKLRLYLADHRFTDSDEPGRADAFALRNRAIVALLLDVGPTTEELIALRPSQINSAKSSVLVTLDGKRDASRRHLRLGRQASSALRQWMRHHMTVSPTRDHVFFGKKGNNPVSKVLIFCVVRDFLRAALPPLGLEHTGHQGPALLRTSVINEWILDGMSNEDVIARAGLSGYQSLRRIIAANQRTSG